MPINYTPELIGLFNYVKKNRREGVYSYMAYDMSAVKPQIKATVKVRDSFDPSLLIPTNLDQPVMGKKYTQTDVLTTLFTQLHRYARAKSVNHNRKFEGYTSELRNMFARRFFKSQVFPKVSNELISKHMNPVIAKMQASGGVFHDLNISLRPLSETYTIHFFLKDITKCVMAKSNDVSKVGQGISAWTKTLNAVFCPLFRAIEEVFKKSLRKNVLFENAIMEEDYDCFVEDHYKFEACKHVRDYKEYDSFQDADTQLCEDILLEGFVDRKFLRLYRAMRLKAKQRAQNCTLQNIGGKNSGESATLFTNTLLNMFLSAMSTKVRGVHCEMYKGDDSLINADSVEVHNWLADLDPSLRLPMVADMDFPIHADFAGYWISSYGIIPDVLKILCKFISKDFSRSEKYRRELSESLVDKSKFFTYQKLLYLRKVYWDLYRIDDFCFHQMMSTYAYYMGEFEEDANLVGMNALMVSSACRETDELTPAEKDMKRRKNAYACVDDFCF